MTRILLFLLFFVLLAADTLGVALSLAPGLSVKNAFLYLIFAGIAMDAAIKRNRNLELMSVFVPYALYLFYALTTLIVVVLIVDYPRYSALRAIVSFKSGPADNLLVLMVFFYGVSTASECISIFKMMVWTVALSSLVTVLDGLNIPDLGLIEEGLDGRTGGPIGEHNMYGAFLALFLPACVALALIERGALRVLALSGVAVSVIALLMTASRGAFVGLVGGSVFSAVMLRKYVTKKGLGVGVAAFLALVTSGVTIMYFGGYGDLLYNRFIWDSTGGDATKISSGRIFIWATAIEKMLTQPVTLITGFGWDAYFQFRVFRFAPHNVYLKIFFELGAIGLILMLVALFNILRIARGSLRWAEGESSIIILGFIFGLISILIAMFFVDISTPWIFIWAYVGTVMRLALLQSDTSYSTRVREGHSSSFYNYPGPA